MSKSVDSGDKVVAGCGSHMQSIARIDEDGTIHLKTHTFTRCQLKGFTGGTKVILSDSYGKVIYQTPTESYGVDGVSIPFKDSDRWDEREYRFDSSIYKKIDRIDVIVCHNPHNRLLKDLLIIADILTIVFELYEKWCKGSGDVNSSGDSGGYTYDAGDGSYLYGTYAQHLTAPVKTTPITLKTYDGIHFVCAENGGGQELVANRTEARGWETFGVLGNFVFGGSISLRTYDRGHFVCAENGGGRELVANRTEAREWETFKIIGPNGKTDGSLVKNGDKISLLTYDGGHFVCAENGGGQELVANRTEAREWETFTIDII